LTIPYDQHMNHYGHAYTVAMDQKNVFLLFGAGCVVIVVGLALAQYLLTLITIAFIILVFLYSEFKIWYESTKTNLMEIESRVEALEKK
jgi:hypothetical protein